MRDGRLGHAVDGLTWQGDEAGLAAHVDDPAVALGRHHPARRLAGEEGPLQVDSQGGVEVLLGGVEGGVARGNPGVVDQDVQPAEVAGRRVDGPAHLGEVGDVHGQGQAAPPGRLHGPDDAGGGPQGTQADRDVGAGVSEGHRDGPAQAARCSADQRNSALQGKRRHRLHPGDSTEPSPGGPGPERQPAVAGLVPDMTAASATTGSEVTSVKPALA